MSTAYTREEVVWKDNIGNEIHAGDLVLTINGKFTIERVNKLGTMDCGSYFAATVVFKGGRKMHTRYILSLSAIGITEESINENAGKRGFDAIGNPLSVGGLVLSVPRLGGMVEKGTVLKICPQTCKISRSDTYYHQEYHNRKYNEIISLSALGKENIEIIPTL